MTELTGAQWRMHSNMKAAPNSQGTLFQGGNAQRYPRGYTPERSREVEANLSENNFENMRKSADTRAIIDTVKRSTVPAEIVQNVTFHGTGGGMGRQRGMGQGLAIGGSYAGGTKFDETFDNKILTGTIKVSGGQESTTTPIHELGHHQSRLLGRPSSQYNTVSRRGADEGFAETFAETHSRDRRGRPPADFSTNPLSWSSGMNNASRAQFAKHFDKEREGTPQHERQKKASASFAARGAQEPLFDVHRMQIDSHIENMLKATRRSA